jgi:hypothetical protein
MRKQHSERPCIDVSGQEAAWITGRADSGETSSRRRHKDAGPLLSPYQPFLSRLLLSVGESQQGAYGCLPACLPLACRSTAKRMKLAGLMAGSTDHDVASIARDHAHDL